MVYEVYHWYSMKDVHHTSAKHFQMIILHVPHFEPTQTISTCGLVRLVIQIFVAERWPLSWIIHPHIDRQFVWTDRT